MPILALLFGFSLFGIHFGNPSLPFKQTERFVVDVRQTMPLSVSTASGDITVVRGVAHQIEVTVVKRGQTPAQLAGLHVRRHVSDTAVSLQARYPSGCNWNCGQVSFRIAVPPMTRLTLVTSSGDVVVKQMSASVAATTASGDVQIDGAARSPQSWVRIKDSSGDISIADVTGTVSASDSSGDISASELSGSATLVSSSGDVRAAVSSLTAVKTLKLYTSSGDVWLGLPARPSVDLHAATASGSIRSNLGLSIHGKYGSRSVDARLGTGATAISLSTASGDIAIDAR
ncbi:MAG: DUF4097 family beta strand repeat-containing protein [Vulcanimicrobiaceae bacterium]